MLEQSETPPWPGTPKTSSEYVTLIAHYYRAEMGRMSGWRDRIDRTTNWAITVAGAMLSLSLSAPTSNHGVLLFAMVLVLLLLVIESRRYRFFDVYRVRVRRLERQYESGPGIFPTLAPQLYLDVPDPACWRAR